MPTGYTQKLVESGQTFKEFALQCARAMGATIMMRDDPFDAQIPEFKPSEYNLERLKESKSELERLLAMGEDDRIDFGLSGKIKEHELNLAYLAKTQAGNSRLYDMKGEVEAWTPPTPDHKGMKKFMLEQIEMSITGVDYYDEALQKNDAKHPMEFWLSAVAGACDSIARNAKSDHEERERTKSRNQWVEDLKKSLIQPTE